jgi:hypothetical protein
VQLPPPPSDSTKKALAKAVLLNDFKLSGSKLSLLGHIVDGVGYMDNALQLLEIAGLIAEGTTIATIASFAAGILSPVGFGAGLLEAEETGYKIAGMAAQAYAVTAWTFDDPIPPLPDRVRNNLRSNGQADEIQNYENAWRENTEVAVNKLIQVTSGPGHSKKAFQNANRAASNFSRQKLSRTMLDWFSDQSSDQKMAKIIFEGFEYPN